MALFGSVLLRGADSNAADLPGPRPKRVYQATRLSGEPPVIDGLLEDAAWTGPGKWSGNYTQQEPDEGQPATQATQLKIVYDDRHVYVAIRAFDTEITAVPHLRGQRDEFTGDMVGITFDSYHDRRTAFEFDVTSGGSKIDLQIRDEDVDTTWNAVWDVRVAHDADGWTAEYRIPFSQLRYAKGADQVWGLHSWRWIKRRQEESDWNPIPIDNPGMVYEFGELHGLENLPHARRLELLPYVVLQHTSFPREPGNPFRAAGDTTFDAGLDAKIGLASDLTLDLTLNPDFGQVELDPSEINLTTIETFLDERRPFFIEGKDVFAWSLDDDQLFYSRRIGRAPTRDAEANGGYVDVASAARIRAAAKLTGKTRQGLVIGGLYANTGAVNARIFENGNERRELVEPTAQYFVGRLQQEIARGRTTLGGLATTTIRSLEAGDPVTDLLTRRAYTGGLDFRHLWNDRNYEFLAEVTGSRVEGSPAAIQALMESSVHNFQRPDAGHVAVRTDATTLSGHGGRLRLGKVGGGRWRYDGNYSWRSPGLELNHLGFLAEADRQEFNAEASYVVTKPGPVLRSYEIELEQTETYDFGGVHLQSSTVLAAEIRLNSDWTFEPWIDIDGAGRDTHLLRGGPSFLIPSETEIGVRLTSPGTETWRWHVEVERAVESGGRSRRSMVEAGFTWRALGLLTVVPGVEYETVNDDHQYVDTATTSPGDIERFLLGRMSQRTLGSTLRVDANFSPTLSLSWFGSLFASSGDFSAFKRVTTPLASRYDDRFARLDGSIAPDPGSGGYIVTEGAEIYAFANPDFDERELQSNLVLRWEYRAGSTLYLVWTQNRANSDVYRGFSSREDYRRLLRAPAENTVLLKISHWFSE